MKKRSGVVLMLSLLIMAAITASTIAVAVLITNDFEQTRSLDQFVTASAAADAGVERGLAIVKLNRLSGASLTDTLTQAAISNTAQTPAIFNVTAAQQNSIIPVNLAKDQYIQFDILDNTARYLHVAGSSASSGTLEVSWLLIDQNGNTEYEGRAYESVIQYGSAGTCIPITQVFTGSSNIQGIISNPLGFRIKVRALNSAVQQVTAVPNSDSGCGNSTIINPLKAIRLSSTGTMLESTAQKTVDVVWHPTSSGVFNYVLFTEGNIIPTP